MKISIDTPCHENWEAMQPNNEGAHCFSCQKAVIDFSQKSTHEIKLFFGSIADSQKICGRFKPEQLKELSFDDFFEKFKKWVLPHKLAVLLVFTFAFQIFLLVYVIGFGCYRFCVRCSNYFRLVHYWVFVNTHFRIYSSYIQL